MQIAPAVISNNEDLTKKMIESSKTTSEQIWELPLNQDYMDMINSDVADMKNVGIGRAAGTITAAAFLKNADLLKKLRCMMRKMG